ncbi:ribulokinase [Oceanobacillus kimchii]|uniref:ribulokinase n=1 Tax=Oceanobacillus TaxID=182709 RepID=UPI0003451674|nr:MULTISPECIES: ribulokinase [Oceanobacillus]MCT1578985.1 ribulokinase [Oceanobacillus kimchii]MCT2137910.1 ribulokinase [Oceanobacillus kimchii]OEH53452.1 ribulokinase [Oceanobacillus sp. E9]
MEEKYTIGIDYGTESGRAVLVSLQTGEEISDHVTPYHHGVIDDVLPETGEKLGHEWALQHASDYIEVIQNSVPAVLEQSKVDPEDVIGIGIDFTACTILPVDQHGEPLMFNAKWKQNPNSWVKLWKHHAAQDKANRINEIAEQRREKFLPRYGGKISSEWMIAKVWQVLDEAPEIYEATDKFVEATDWVISKLSGNLIRNSCTAGYKAIWHKQEGFPSKHYFKSLDPRLEDLVETKLRGEIVPLGTNAGGLTEEMALLTGLKPGIAVAVGNVDAHAAVPAMGVTAPGKMVMVMGTSICHMLLGEEEKQIEGMCGVVEDGIIPGYYGYEAGQSAVGDIFAWFVQQGVTAEVKEEARNHDLDIYQFLEWKASNYQPGESGLLALDWWNGNRSVLVDTELSGMILGMTLQTKPEEIYRALLESTAFGTRMIVDAFHQNGVAVDELYACGGLSHKSKLLMQIYADVTNRNIVIADSKHTPALGAAMFAAIAAGSTNGGYDTAIEAANNMARVKEKVIKPISENVYIYEKIFQEYKRLHDYFGRGENDVMKRLKDLRIQEEVNI